MTNKMESKHRSNRNDLPWKTNVHARANELEDEIHQISGSNTHLDDGTKETLKLAQNQIKLARDAVSSPSKDELGLSRLHPFGWAFGVEQETAWLALHAAETHLTLARSEGTLRAEIPALIAKVDTFYSTSSQPGRGWTETLTEEKTAHSINRDTLREIKRSLYAASDKNFERMRSFRNILAAATLIIIVATAGMAAVPGVVNKDWLPLCPAPVTEQATQTTERKEDKADKPSTSSMPAPACPIDTVWKVELLGAIGGLVTALTVLQGLRGYRQPYNLPFVQALLKIPAGALTAFVGVIIVQSGAFGIDAVTGPKMAAYIILFGAAQELVTRLIDQKARTIIEAASPAAASGGTT